MEAYCSRQGLPVNQVRFLYDGERLKDDATPALLNMEDQVCAVCVWREQWLTLLRKKKDVIDAVAMQTGGQ